MVTPGTAPQEASKAGLSLRLPFQWPKRAIGTFGRLRPDPPGRAALDRSYRRGAFQGRSLWRSLRQRLNLACFLSALAFAPGLRHLPGNSAMRPALLWRMDMGSLSIWHWLIVLAVVLVLFGGGNKVSSLMGDFAKGIKSFKKNMAEDDDASMEASADRHTGTISPPGVTTPAGTTTVPPRETTRAL